MSRGAALLALVVCAVALVACGGGDPDAPEPRPAESSDPPDLRPGWSLARNPGGGFAFGLPPGWEARRRGTTSIVRSPDGLVTVAIAADRTREALALPVKEFARRTLEALPGFAHEPAPGEPLPVDHRYEGVLVEAMGEAEGSDVAQRVTVVVLRRPRLVTLSVAIAARDTPAAARSERDAGGLVESLRSRPPG